MTPHKFSAPGIAIAFLEGLGPTEIHYVPRWKQWLLKGEKHWYVDEHNYVLWLIQDACCEAASTTGEASECTIELIRAVESLLAIHEDLTIPSWLAIGLLNDPVDNEMHDILIWEGRQVCVTEEEWSYLPMFSEENREKRAAR